LKKIKLIQAGIGDGVEKRGFQVAVEENTATKAHRS